MVLSLLDVLMYFELILLKSDDGSGSISILEAFRVLIAADFHPVRAVEFHWYSAEVCER